MALDSQLLTDYRTNRRGVTIVDQGVITGYISPSGKPSHHKIYGYLRTPEMSEVLDDFMVS